MRNLRAKRLRELAAAVCLSRSWHILKDNLEEELHPQIEVHHVLQGIATNKNMYQTKVAGKGFIRALSPMHPRWTYKRLKKGESLKTLLEEFTSDKPPHYP